MPNWCENILELSGPPESLKRFVKTIRPVYIDWGDELHRELRRIDDQLADISRQTADGSNTDKTLFLMQRCVELTERRSQILKKLSAVGESPLLFASFVQPNDDDRIRGDWYTWNCNNYGTKWDVEDFILEYAEGDDHAKLCFNTAWSPPTEWVRRVAAMFPDIEFVLTCLEESFEFGYVIEASGGKVCIYDHEALGYASVREFAVKRGFREPDDIGHDASDSLSDVSTAGVREEDSGDASSDKSHKFELMCEDDGDIS